MKPVFASDSDSERATDIADYQRTCAEFVKEISRDYKDWVDRHNLGEAESEKRKSNIESIVRTSNDWIFRYADSIRKVDVVMNDGVNKMAENTAGYPFFFEIRINDTTRYTLSTVGKISFQLKALPRSGRTVRLGNYQRDHLALVNSSGPVELIVSKQSLMDSDLLDDFVVLDASRCTKGDLVSITLVVEEIHNCNVVESRGYSTLIFLT